MKNKQICWIPLISALAAGFTGCSSDKIRPVDIYPEDACSYCRMAISDHAFAAEIITQNHEALKFDDIGCLEAYSESVADSGIAARFVIDYRTREWLPLESSFVVQTGVSTPMSSGKVAFGDSSEANSFLREHPPAATADNEDN